MNRRRIPVGLLSIALAFGFAPAGAQMQDAAREVAYQKYWEFASLVRGGVAQPFWLPDGRSFWYADHGPDSTVIYRVDPALPTHVAHSWNNSTLSG